LYNSKSFPSPVSSVNEDVVVRLSATAFLSCAPNVRRVA
jgi:hypothetical protein